VNVTPDGRRYLAIANGERVARPFHYRWLVPWICGTHARRWRWTAEISTAGLALTAAWWVQLHGFDWRYQLAAPFLVAGLMGVWGFNRTYPVLVDAPAMLLALLAACTLEAGWWPAAIVFVLLAGATKETAPGFAALWAWNPVLLVGLVAPAIRFLQRSGEDVLDERNAWILAHPFRAAREFHQGRWLDWRLMVAPWGVLLTALWEPDVQLVVVLAVAYGQLLVATDSVRLYQWAWPAALVAALGVVPAELLAVAVIAHLYNPFAGDGC